MDLNWSPFAVGGAAARPDSFTGLQPAFAANVHNMVTDAHAAGFPLQITSAYRSPELQGQLYEAAIQKYGSPEAARKWVAPPGKSKHNTGQAVDFALNGGLLRDANSPAAKWVSENAANYGLSVPMSWEPWQVEPMGSRDAAPAIMAQTEQASGGILDTSDMQTPEQKRAGILASIGEGLMQEQPSSAPVQFAPRQAQPIQAASRDPMTAYLQFIQSMGA